MDYRRLGLIFFVLPVKILEHVKLRSLPSLGRKQRKKLLWIDAGKANVLAATEKLVLTLSAVTDEEGAPLENVKGMYTAPSYSRTFTIHKWLRQTAYILTHNMNNLEHIANNGTDTTKHTDVYNAQF